MILLFYLFRNIYLFSGPYQGFFFFWGGAKKGFWGEGLQKNLKTHQKFVYIPFLRFYKSDKRFREGEGKNPWPPLDTALYVLLRIENLDSAVLYMNRVR